MTAESGTGRRPNPDVSGVSTWRRAATFERGIYGNLWRWARRRPDLGPEGTLPVPYVGLVNATIWVWIGASALEMAVVHLVIPWPWVRWPLLIVSLWGLVWMLGYLAGLVVRPHLVESGRLVVRNGHTIRVEVPLGMIRSVTTSRGSRESSRVVQLDDGEEPHLPIAISSQVNVHVELAEPLTAELPGGRYTCRRLSLWADDPAPLVTRLRQQLRA